MGIARLFFKRFFSQSVQAIRPHNERSGAALALDYKNFEEA
jgi:hypothetical protein